MKQSHTHHFAVIEWMNLITIGRHSNFLVAPLRFKKAYKVIVYPLIDRAKIDLFHLILKFVTSDIL
jgi:hypothetical protein